MKKKISALVFIRYLLLGALFTVCFTACPFHDCDHSAISVYSLSDAKKKLADHTFYGNKPENPLTVLVYMDIGDLSQPVSDYLRLIEIIGDSGLYATLQLGRAKMSGTTVFTSPPLNEAVKGMEKIVGINGFPNNTTSIMADENGKSPFYFYENLVSVGAGGNYLTNIGDYAFSSCKSLEQIDAGGVKTVGNEAFRGCENLKRVSLILSEEIGDYAFFDCDEALEWISMYREPPTLGDSVFLGSTSGSFTLSIKRAHEGLYRTWLNENASKFNNNGKYYFQS